MSIVARKILSVVASTAMAAAMMAVAPASASGDDPGTGTISGTVTGPSDGALGNVDVVVIGGGGGGPSGPGGPVGGGSIGGGSAGASFMEDVKTAADGTFSIADVPVGSYQVCFNAAGATMASGSGSDTGYVSKCVGQAGDGWWDGLTPAADAPSSVTVTSGVAADATMELAVGAAVSGTVKASGGSGIENVDPAVREPGFPNRAVGTIDWSPSDTNGDYRVTGWPAEVPLALCFDTSHAANTSNPGGYIPVCSDGTPWPSTSPTATAGTPLTLTAGETRSDVDAELAPGGSILGIVTATDSARLQGVSAYVFGPGGTVYGPFATGTDGGFQTFGLTGGNYSVCFDVGTAQGSAGSTYSDACYHDVSWTAAASLQAPAGATPVSVTVGEVSHLGTVEVPEAAAINGTVTDSADGGVLSNICVTLYDATGNWVNSTCTDANGAYSFASVSAGTYTEKFFTDPGSAGPGYVAQWSGGASDKDHATPITVAAGATETVDASMVKGASISGTIKDASGSPIVGACVSPDLSTGATTGDTLSACSGTDGTYTILGIPAGTYTVEFNSGQTPAPGYLGQWWPDEADPADAQEITVAGGDVVTGKDATLAVGSAITGTVKDADGNPVVNICPEPTTADGSAQPEGVVISCSSPFDGTYQIVGLPAGSYAVEFSDDSGAYQTQYYNGVSTLDAATPVTTTIGHTETGKDAAMVRTADAVPGAPAGLVAAAGDGEIDLSWTAPSSRNAVSYNVYEVTGPDASATVPINATPLLDNSYSARNLTNGTAYAFTVAAIGAGDAGSGPQSASASATPSTDYINVPDFGLRAGINASLSHGAAAAITRADAPNVLAVTATGKIIRDLSGMQELTSLTSADLEYNQIRDLAPLAGLASLTALNLAHNFVSNASPLGGLTGLTSLDLSDNWLADASPLGGLTSLISLDLSGQHARTSTAHPGAATVNPVRSINGDTVTVTSTDSGFTYDDDADTWSFSDTGNMSLTWSTAVAFGAVSTTFDGTVSQVVVGDSTPVAITPASHLDATAANGQVSLTWTAAQTSGSSTLTDYRIEVSPYCAGCTGLSAGASATSTTITGLTNGTPYTFRVVASDNNDEQAYSAGVVGIPQQDPSAGAIVGTVTNATSGLPVADMCAVATVAGGDGSTVALDCTDSDGEYAILGLQPGDYDVAFVNGDIGPGYVEQSWNGKAPDSAGDPIAVTSGKTVARIDAAVEPGGAVSGTVTDASTSDPASGICPTAFDATTGARGAGTPTCTGSSGKYYLVGLPTGSYKIGFASASDPTHVVTYYGSSDLGSATPIEVTAGESKAGLDVSVPTGGESTSVAPQVTTQPTGQSVTAGATATFTAAASGTPAPSVQWQSKAPGASSFADISGATATTLTLSSVSADNSGTQYQAVFTNSAGSATSSSAALTVTPAADDPVIDIPDAGLKAAINAAIGSNTGNSDRSATAAITKTEAQGVTYLSADGDGIVDLTGIENLTGLTDLSLQNNQISNITPLAGLTGISELFLGGNQVSDITPLAALTGLDTLYLDGNQINDVTSLSGLQGLKLLGLSFNQISDITPLAGLGLFSLDLSSNPVSDITPLANLTKLTDLGVSSTLISDITPLAKLTNLTDLSLYSNQISGITSLANLTDLTTLNLSSNPIGDITPLSKLTGLTSLYLDSNQISDITPLAGLTNLTYLDLNGNRIGDITPLSELTGLTSLYLDSNQISDITPLAGLTNLTDLSLYQQNVSVPDVIVGQSTANPVVAADGSPVGISSGDGFSLIDPGHWSFTTAGAKTLSWSAPVTVGTASAVFDGTITQNVTVAATAPQVTTDPTDVSVTAGQSVSFTAAASGTPAPTVQWQASTDGTTWSDVSGATSTTLTITNTTKAMSGTQYRAVFTNSVDSVTTIAATLTVTGGSTGGGDTGNTGGGGTSGGGDTSQPNPPATTPTTPQEPVTTTVKAGGTASSAPQAQPTVNNPVVASVQSPVAGTVTFTPVASAAPQTGYTMLGHSFVISAPAATPQKPLQLSFAVDTGALPTGVNLADLTVFRDGVPVPVCVGTSGVADPDPCVTSVTTASGDASVKVLSSHASTWTFGVKGEADGNRIAGSNRFVTASKIATQFGTANAVVLANGTDAKGGADALAANYLAGWVGAPILLVQANSVDPQVLAAVKAVLKGAANPTIYVMGGADAVSNAVVSDVQAAAKSVATGTAKMVRVAGANRYATSALAAAKAGAVANSIGFSSSATARKTAILASGLVNADALAAGPLSYAWGIPVLLTGGGALPESVASAIKTLGITQLIVLGGADRVSEDALAQAKAVGVVSVKRIAGADRYATAVQLYGFVFGTAVNADGEHYGADSVYLANGVSGFPDALSVGPLAGKSEAALLTTAPGTLASAAAKFLSGHAGSLTTAIGLGQAPTLAASVLAAAQKAIG